MESAPKNQGWNVFNCAGSPKNIYLSCVGAVTEPE